MELLGMQLSTGFAACLRGRAAALTRDGGFCDAIKGLLASARVVHAGRDVRPRCGGTTFAHVACTEHLTVMHTGDRSAATIDDGGVLPHLGPEQALIRDGYVGYTHLSDVLHPWCGANLLRDLRGIHEAAPVRQLWPRRWPTPCWKPTGSPPPPAPKAVTSSPPTNWPRTDNPTTDHSVLAGHARTLAKRFDTHRETILRFTTKPRRGLHEQPRRRTNQTRQGPATIIRRMLANTPRTGRFRRRPLLPVHRRRLGHHPNPGPAPPPQRRRPLDPLGHPGVMTQRGPRHLCVIRIGHEDDPVSTGLARSMTPTQSLTSTS